MQIIKPKNWREFQHYKRRYPPWIKIHRRILTNKQFLSLPDASQALAIKLWLLASESKTGEIEFDSEEIAHRIRRTEKELEVALNPLIDGEFFIIYDDASIAIASCKQDATPEKRREETEKRREERGGFPKDKIKTLLDELRGR